MNIIIINNSNNNWTKKDVYRYQWYIFAYTDANRYEETTSESFFFSDEETRLSIEQTQE